MTTKYLLECYYEEKCRIAVAQGSDIEFVSGPVHFQCGTEFISESLLPYLPEPSVDDRQRIRAIARNLRAEADQVEIRILNRRALHREGLSNEEIQVVRRIYAERASTTLSTIATHLKECLTPCTFHMALSLLSSNISTEFEQLAAACKLVTLLYPRVQQAIHAGRIYDVLQEFIEDKLEEVLH